MRLGEHDAHKRHVRRRRKRAVKNVTIFVLILAVLFSVAGFGYTWYAGQQPVPAAPDISSLPKQRSKPKPTAPSKNSPVGIAVQTFSSPIAPNQNASLAIKTLPGAACSVLFTYNKDKEISKDTGLIPKIADEYGYVDWTWKVTVQVQPGTWPVEVTCANGNKSSYSKSELVVK